MNSQKETFIAIICTAYIEIVLLAIPPLWIYNHFFVYGSATRRETVSINWEALYPFENDDTAESENGENRRGASSKNILTQYRDTMLAVTAKLESVTNNNTLLRYPLSEFYCNIWNTMGLYRIPDSERSLMALDNGYFSYNYGEINNDAIAGKVQEFQESLNTRGIDFLYVMAPYKYSETDENNIYKGYVDYARENAVNLAAGLQAHNVNFFNLHELAAIQGKNLNGLFFRTDHHWKPSSALWGAKEVAAELNKNFGFDINLGLYNEELFSMQTYQNYFLGSQGKKVTLAYTQPEDFEILTPTYATSYHIIVPYYNLDFNGTFEETMIDHLALKEINKSRQYYQAGAYSAYGYGDQPLISIRNLSIDSDKKVLIIKDSFADTLAPFLSLGLSDMAVIDLRHFTGSLQSFINDYEPDMVILLMSGGTQKDIYEDFNEHKNMYDFR